ncbi:hypothetical protein J4573_50375 [Actinomadura barringtoniae]|uniref:LigA protein n=1 Tax=Actinomadura barringtoniae TaxID=1427535 RepID=A0A939TGF3_9ACTN|nr:hypothetical protein [Actinomadura barringtoniae]MBO2455365.1 hypothetical protein [Actinomadura barringtoniae]
MTPQRLWRLRLFVCYATAAACVPYLFLKVVWVAGGDLGVKGTMDMHSGDVVAANVITLGMDAVAVVIALAFAYPWGMRVPAWLMLVPIWVGTGLLAPFVLGLPLGLAVQAVVGGAPAPDDHGNGLHAWVFVVVYGGFILQGVTLLAGFVLHARVRWADLFAMRTRELGQGPTRALQVLAVNGAAVVAAVFGVVHLVWAFGGTAAGGDPGFQTATQRTFVGVSGVLAFLGAAGALALVHRRGPERLLPVLVATWLGAGAIFAGGLLGSGASGFASAVATYGTIAGLLLGIAGLLALIEGRRGLEGDLPAAALLAGGPEHQ